MAGNALIRLDQPAHPTVPVGQPGQARDDLVLGQPVTARNVDDTDVIKRIWTLRDIPLGSAAALSSTTSPVVTFTPDVEGSYLLQLTVNDGLDGQIDNKIAAVRTSLGIRYPATGEVASMVNWPGNDSKGWGKDAEQALRGLASPQLIAGVTQFSVPVAASTVLSVGGIGLPSVLGDIVDEGFVDLGAAVGTEPAVNGYAFVTLLGSNGKQIQGLLVDLDTTASVVGDEWAMVIGLADVGNLFALRIMIV
jgi:hypothetical protein